MPELKPLPGSIGLDDVMEAVDYHAKACVDRAAGSKVDTASTRLKLSLLIAHYAENRRAPPEQPAAPSVVEPVAWNDIPEKLFQYIKHGDEAHQAWLRESLKQWFTAHPPRAPLTEEEVDLMWRRAYADHCGTTMSFDWFEAGVRALEGRLGAGRAG